MRSLRGYEIAVFIVATATIGCRAQPPPTRQTGERSNRPHTHERQQQHQATVASNVDSELLAAQLEDAFSTSSTEKLADFFRRWHNSIRPKDIKEINDPLERELYSVFQHFFKPFGLNTIAGCAGYNDVIEIHESAKYVIVQDTLRFQVGETTIRTVTDFRPPVTFDSVDVLYLTPTYREALVAFLEADENDVDESLKRFQFLITHAFVFPAHWGLGWYLTTSPTVSLVELNETTTRAVVHSSVLSDGLITVMERTADGWQMTDTGIFYIQ